MAANRFKYKYNVLAEKQWNPSWISGEIVHNIIAHHSIMVTYQIRQLTSITSYVVLDVAGSFRWRRISRKTYTSLCQNTSWFPVCDFTSTIKYQKQNNNCTIDIIAKKLTNKKHVNMNNSQSVPYIIKLEKGRRIMHNETYTHTLPISHLQFTQWNVYSHSAHISFTVHTMKRILTLCPYLIYSSR